MEVDVVIAKETPEEPNISSEELLEEKPEAPTLPSLGNLKKPRNLIVIAAVGLFLLGTVAFLYFARAVFLPIVLALMLSFLLKPVVKAIARTGIPPAVGAALVLLLGLWCLGSSINRLTQPATEFIANLPENIRRVEAKMRQFIWRAEQLTRAATKVENMTKGNPTEKPATEVKVTNNTLVDSMFSMTTSFLAGALETGVLLYFFLAYGEFFLQKMVKLLPNFHEKKRAAAITHELQYHISSFLFTVSSINACLGLLVGTGVWLVGLSNPVLWGVAAALLNFIPYFGPIVGVSVLTLAGLLTFDSVGRALVPPLIYLTLHALEANFITPMILGRRLTMNPVVIFVSFMFWTWLWGIPGALLSVPLLMTIKVLCDHFKPLAPIGEFLSG